ncbi:hypothetical protein [uncultured Nisaea sp.]|uniref:hypothetical protein n=1 Tax=uncultured Nisaea sp. TaxID=538215 RepID=UPI0030ECC9E3|tara:strand:- start:6528 stop:7031 length:504 start_codon:yes stop_codon:yes gene_type:complete
MRIVLIALGCVFLWSGAARSQDVTEGDLNAEMRYQGGQNVFQHDWQVETGDVTCDGFQDKVAGYVSHDNPDGASFLMVVVTHEEGVLVSESVLPFFDSADQTGLCGDGNPPPKISLEQFTEEEVREMTGIEGACPVAIILEDGMCDLHYYFWVPDWEEDRKLVFFRN